jgi:hypothetical protein
MAQQLRAAGKQIVSLALVAKCIHLKASILSLHINFGRKKAGMLKEKIRSALYKDKFLVFLKE